MTARFIAPSVRRRLVASKITRCLKIKLLPQIRGVGIQDALGGAPQAVVALGPTASAGSTSSSACLGPAYAVRLGPAALLGRPDHENFVDEETVVTENWERPT
jgi:hypothetical protein